MGPSRDGFAMGGSVAVGLRVCAADGRCLGSIRGGRRVPARCAARRGGPVWRSAGAGPRGGPSRRRAPQCEEPVAQPRHLGAGTGGARRAQPEFLHQHVGGGGEEHAQLIGPEATAARAVDLQAIEQFLDAVLDVAAGAVDPFIEGSAASGADWSRRSAGCRAARGRRAGRPRP